MDDPSPQSASFGIGTSPSQIPDSLFWAHLNQMSADLDGLWHAPMMVATPERSSRASIPITFFSPSPTVNMSNQTWRNSGGVASDSDEFTINVPPGGAAPALV